MNTRTSKHQVQVAFDYMKNSAALAGVDSSRWTIDKQPGGYRAATNGGGSYLFGGPRLPAYWFVIQCETAGDTFHLTTK